MRNSCIIVGLLVVLWCVIPSSSIAEAAEEDLAPQNVLVVVESFNGWWRTTRSGLSCDGRFRILGAYSDTTTIRGLVSQDSALTVINELLALNFFEQPARFGSDRLQLAYSDNQHLAVHSEETMDAGSTMIELHVGRKSHSVMLAYPAHGAPAALHEWVRRFERFMKDNRGW